MGSGSQFWALGVACLLFDFKPLGFQFFHLEVHLRPLGTDFRLFGVDFRHLGVILAFGRQITASEVRFFASGSPV